MAAPLGLADPFPARITIKPVGRAINVAAATFIARQGTGSAGGDMDCRDAGKVGVRGGGWCPGKNPDIAKGGLRTACRSSRAGFEPRKGGCDGGYRGVRTIGMWGFGID
jgi:hypothetical protein